MTTVTGLTADRMIAIEQASVVDGDVIGNDLILTTKGGTQINAGNVRGPKGDPGPVGTDLAVLTAKPVLEVGLLDQIRAGRQLTPADFTNMGLNIPIGLWNLSDLNDSSGNGRNLLNKGAVTTGLGINGLANTAALFIGSAAQSLYIQDSGAADPFRITTGSMGAWFKTALRGGGANGGQVIMSKTNAALTSAASSFQLYVGNGNALSLWLAGFGGADIQLYASSDVADDRWHFGVVTLDASRVALFVDGQLEAEHIQTMHMNPNATGPFNIGSRAADASVAASVPFFGRLDEAFITGDVLSEDQVRSLYCARLPHTLGVIPGSSSMRVQRRRRGSAFAAADFPAQPVRLYNFSAGSLADAGSNNQPLTIVNAARNVAGADGTSGNGFHFYSSNAQVLQATDAGLPTTARSFGCWFKTSSPITQVIMGWGSGAGMDAGAVIGTLNTGVLRHQSVGSATHGPYVVDGLWHLVVCVDDPTAADGLKIRIYLDGRMAASNLASNVVTLGGAGRFRIGNSGDGTLPFNGTIDGVFVYNGVLTAEQVYALYAKGSQLLAPSPKNVGDHVELMTAAELLAAFDTLDTTALVDLTVRA